MQRGDSLRRRSDFRHVLTAGERVVSPAFVLYHVARQPDAPERPRVGFSVPRRVGGAVVRNRVKRLLREAVRPLYPQLVARDIVIAARVEVASAKLAALRDDLTDAVARAGLIRSDTR